MVSRLPQFSFNQGQLIWQAVYYVLMHDLAATDVAVAFLKR